MQFIFPRVFGSKLLKKQNFDKFSSKFLSNTYQPKANQEEIAGKLKGFYKLHLILTRKKLKNVVYNTVECPKVNRFYIERVVV